MHKCSALLLHSTYESGTKTVIPAVTEEDTLQGRVSVAVKRNRYATVTVKSINYTEE